MAYDLENLASVGELVADLRDFAMRDGDVARTRDQIDEALVALIDQRIRRAMEATGLLWVPPPEGPDAADLHGPPEDIGTGLYRMVDGGVCGDDPEPQQF